MVSENIHHLLGLGARGVLGLATHKYHKDALINYPDNLFPERQHDFCSRYVMRYSSIFYIINDEIEPSRKFSIYKKLRKRIPPRMLLQKLPNITLLNHIKSSIPHLYLIQHFNGSCLIAITRLLPRAFHE